MIILYNPECSKCKHAEDRLSAASCEFTIRNYLVDPLSAEEIRQLLQKLKRPVMDIIRVTDPFFLENYSGRSFTDAQWISVLAQHPELLQRPIIIRGDRAVIGRDEIAIESILKV
jgi:arsenate reductase (glutaredoxin)